MIHTRVAAVFIAALMLNGCALFSKGDVPMRRYFSPDLPSNAAKDAPRSNAELRLGRVTGAQTIAERIIFRESEHEVGFYDDRLWTEKPELYLRRGLARVLFEEQGLRSVMRGAGPTLDVELIRFEEVKTPQHVARVKVSFALSDERVVSLQQTLSFEKPVAPSTKETEASAVAQAMGEALREAVDEISNRVIADLSKTAGVITPCPVAATP